MVTFRCPRPSATPCACRPRRSRTRARRSRSGRRGRSDFDVDLVATLGPEEGLGELVAAASWSRPSAGVAAFRHPLARDAIYDDVPWLRRRALHRELAAALEERGHDGARDRGALACRARHGSRADGAPAGDRRACVDARLPRCDTVGRQALDLWPEGERSAERIAVVERHARYAELAADLGEAARAQREVVAARRAEGAGRALADAERRIAGIYALQGDRERALTRAVSPRRRSPRTACPATRRPSGWSPPGICRAPESTRRQQRPLGSPARRRSAPSVPTCGPGPWGWRASRP